MSGAATDVQEFGHAELLSAVRSALSSSSAGISDWRAGPLSYDRTMPTSGGLFRVTGTARDGDRIVPWSVILKVAHTPAGTIFPDGRSMSPAQAEDPASFVYWRREALVYGSGVVDDLPSPLVAPRCYGVTAPDDSVMRIWLEDIVDVTDPRWGRDRYMLAARHLGRFNGWYLAGQPLPNAPYLAAGRLRTWVEHQGARMLEKVRDERLWDHPLLRATLDRSTYGRLFGLWDARTELLQALERLPRTFCHRDAFRPNLLARVRADGHPETVAIDWAFAGIGPVGEEIGPLIAMRPAADPEGFGPWDLEQPVFEGYLQGLEESGWPADGRVVRLGYAAAVALRYVFLAASGLLRDAQNEGAYAQVEARRGQPIAHVVESQARLLLFLLDRADEARELMRSCASLS